MATIEKFNQEIELVKQDRRSAVIGLKTDGTFRSVSIHARKSQLFVFHQVVDSRLYDHAALVTNDRVMAIWHAQPPTSAAPEAAREDGPAEDEYIDEPVNSKPLYTVTVDNCCGEVAALTHKLEAALVALRRIHQLPKSGDVLDDAAEMQATAYLALLAADALSEGE